MRRDILKELLKSCASLAIAMLVALTACLLIALCSCRGAKTVTERVEVPVIVTQEHTVESVRIDHVRDTLIQRDSIYHYVQGDTVLIEKWHYLQGSSNVVRVDTLHVYDSVPYPVEVTKEVTKVKEVEKPLKWWQQALMWLGVALFGFIGYKVYSICKR